MRIVPGCVPASYRRIALALVVLGSPLVAQAVDLAALAKKMDASEQSVASVSRMGGLTTTLHRVRGSALTLTGVDELQIQVVAGHGTLKTGGKESALTSGALVPVAGKPCTFKGDLTLLMTRPTGVPHTGGMAAGPRPVRQTPYPETSPRGSTRIFYWFGPGSAGQLEIGYGIPPWKAAYEKFMTTPSDRRWRFGQNFWTRLDSNIDLTIGGVKVPAGYRYLVLKNDAKKGLMLVALDPSTAYAGLLDAWHAPQTKPANADIEIPLTHTKGLHVGRLDIKLTVDRSKEDTGALTIRFGPHVLSAPLVMHPKK